MTLREKQTKFAYMVGLLLVWCKQMNYEVTFGETVRSPATATFKRSLHIIRLAIDLNLFIGGKYQQATEAYRPLGEFWESIGGTWGGRFNDGNHFSLEHNGVK